MKHIKDFLAKGPNTSGWQDRHKAAVRHAQQTPQFYKPTLESSIALAIEAWCDYAEAHAARFEGQIGEDYVLGPAWARWGFALRELLNGDCGRLDCATLDSIIHDNLSEQGFSPAMGPP
jgi:hypothetical protein